MGGRGHGQVESGDDAGAMGRWETMAPSDTSGSITRAMSCSIAAARCLLLVALGYAALARHCFFAGVASFCAENFVRQLSLKNHVFNICLPFWQRFWKFLDRAGMGETDSRQKGEQAQAQRRDYGTHGEPGMNPTKPCTSFWRLLCPTCCGPSSFEVSLPGGGGRNRQQARETQA